MNEIAAGRLLEAWEQGQTQHVLHRALTLLRVAEANHSIDDLASLSIGERDRRLLNLRLRLFGSRFDAVATCPQCQEKLDLRFGAEQLSSQAAGASAEISIGGQTFTVRVPDTI